MARRDAVFGRDPLGFQQRKLGEAHEDGIERAGLQARFTAKFVTVTPGRGMLDETLEHPERLRG